MARTTATEVKEIIKTKLTEAEVTPYVTSANILVTQVLGSSGLGFDVLREIERWVSAHMIAVTKTRQATDEKAAVTNDRATIRRAFMGCFLLKGDGNRAWVCHDWAAWYSLESSVARRFAAGS